MYQILSESVGFCIEDTTKHFGLFLSGSQCIYEHTLNVITDRQNLSNPAVSNGGSEGLDSSPWALPVQFFIESSSHSAVAAPVRTEYFLMCNITMYELFRRSSKAGTPERKIRHWERFQKFYRIGFCAEKCHIYLQLLLHDRDHISDQLWLTLKLNCTHRETRDPVWDMAFDRSIIASSLYFVTLLCLTLQTEGFPWDNLCKILHGCHTVARIQDGEKCRRIFQPLIRAHECYRRQTDDRRICDSKDPNVM